MTRVAITEDEHWPVYGITPVDLEVLADHPGAGIEVDQAFIDEYNRARGAWNAMQARLGEFARRWRADE